MKSKSLILSIFVFLLSCAHSAFAIDLDSAKDRGLVGETPSGYLASPKDSPTPEVLILIKDINGKRKLKFNEVAKKQGISVESVAKIFAEKAAAKTKSGHFVQNSSGQWVKR